MIQCQEALSQCTPLVSWHAYISSLSLYFLMNAIVVCVSFLYLFRVGSREHFTLTGVQNIAFEL